MATMANVIKIKKSETAASVPTTGDLVAGEVAINSTDKTIYVRASTGIVAVANYTDTASISARLNILEFGTGIVFPTGEYGDMGILESDSFGYLLDFTFDCSDTPIGYLAEYDLGALT
jgi:hypothetical protein